MDSMHNHPGIPRERVCKGFFYFFSCLIDDCYNQCNLIQSLKWHIEYKHHRCYCNCNKCDFEITARSSLKVYKQVKHRILSNINVNSVVMKQQLLSTNERATNIGIMYIVYQCTQCDCKSAEKYSLSKHKHIEVIYKCD